MLCPICKRPVDETTAGKPGSPYPFCCERCKLIDLGRWLGGRYQVPVVELDESEPVHPIDPEQEGGGGGLKGSGGRGGGRGRGRSGRGRAD